MVYLSKYTCKQKLIKITIIKMADNEQRIGYTTKYYKIIVLMSTVDTSGLDDVKVAAVIACKRERTRKSIVSRFN